MMKRKFIQLLSLIGINSNFAVFHKFGIYQGKWKQLFPPALNCYACPLARGACPVGTLQHFTAIKQIPYYALGYISVIGSLIGRFSCGWFCPFGFIQELLYKIGTLKIHVGKWAGYVKYITLVLLIPAVYLSEEPVFCKLCPAGTLEGGIPVMLSSMGKDMHSIIGWHFYFKLGILVLLIVSAMAIKRPFCRFLCPLGAIWGLFNKVSLLTMHVDEQKCDKCDLCQDVCPMDIKIYEDPNSFDCIRCMQCVSVCPQNAISYGTVFGKTGKTAANNLVINKR